MEAQARDNGEWLGPGSQSEAEDKLVNLIDSICAAEASTVNLIDSMGVQTTVCQYIISQFYMSTEEFLQTQMRYFHENMGTSNK